MGLVVFWQIRFNGENELFKMQKVIELKHQVSAMFQCLMSYEVTTAAKCRSLIPGCTSEWLSSLSLFLWDPVSSLSFVIRAYELISQRNHRLFFGRDSMDMK